MAKKKKSKKDLPEELRESAHRIWLAGLGALATAEREGGKLFRTLVDRGEEFETRGRKQAGKQADRIKKTARKATGAAENAWERLESGLDQSLSAALHKVGVPTRKEIQDLSRRVEKLTRSVEKMGGGTASGRKTTKRKAASRKKTVKKKTTRKTSRARA